MNNIIVCIRARGKATRIILEPVGITEEFLKTGNGKSKLNEVTSRQRWDSVDVIPFVERKFRSSDELQKFVLEQYENGNTIPILG
ncbi:MAG: hypothetical protein D6816_16280 [Bacteroidetes bacterium]|nr:MAG: hypothetical protein D6816_16280 [Bacteroidota bacterium]